MQTEENVGKRVRALRKALRLSGAEFGALFGVSQPAVSDWETGKVKKLKAAELARLGEWLIDADPDSPWGELSISQHSPVAALPFRGRTDAIRSVFAGIMDWSTPFEKWEGRLDALGWKHSKRPFEKSKVLEFRAGDATRQAVPSDEMRDNDAERHGKAFLSYLGARWIDPDELNLLEQQDRRTRGVMAFGSLSEKLVEDRESKSELVRPSPAWATYRREPMEPAWWAAGMDVLSLVFEMVERADGSLDEDRLRLVVREAKRWSIARQKMAVSDASLKLMSAIADAHFNSEKPKETTRGKKRR